MNIRKLSAGIVGLSVIILGAFMFARNNQVEQARAATTYYLSTSGSDSASGTSAAPWATFGKAWGVLQAGDTLIVKNGTYTNASPPTGKAGSSGAPITIQAENDGGATATGSMKFRDNQYINIIGMRISGTAPAAFFYSNGSGQTTHHLVFQRTSFRCTDSGVNDDACVMLQDGTNNVTIEDGWAWGGGRYTVECYGGPGGNPPNLGCDNNIFRRLVLRNGPSSSSSGNPQASISMYYANNNLIENVIALDGQQNSNSSNAAFYITAHAPPPNSSGNEYYGIMALGNLGLGFYLDGGVSDNTKVYNSVIWAERDFGIELYKGSGSCNGVIIQNVTVGTSSGKVIDYSNCNATLTNNRASGLPNTAGIQYLPQAKSGSNGGEVLYRYQNRTLTTTSLWPWPYQDRIKQEMCTDVGVSSGFCSKASLSNYIWEYLGNACPAGMCTSSGTPPPPPPPPTLSLSASPSSITAGSSSTITWSSANATSCTASGAWSGSKATSGTQSVAPGSTSVYTLDCTGSSGTATQSVTVTVNAASNTLPQGNFDGIASGVISGWTYDPDAPSSSNSVQIFFNGPAGSGGTLVYSANTNVLRSDINSAKGITGSHGFSFSIPSQYQDNSPHSVYIYGIDINDSTKSTLLTGSPQSFTLGSGTPTPTPSPTISNLSPAGTLALGTLSNGATFYTDRSYTLTSVPSAYSGFAMIKTGNDMACRSTSGASGCVSFTLGSASTVYAGHFANTSSKPSWLTSNFTKTANVITTSQQSFYGNMEVYSRNYSAGTVDLGGNGDANGSGGMYIVFVGPQSGSATPLTGDINQDHIVNSIDYSLLNAKWFTTDATCDLNHDGLVNAIDFSLLNANWFKIW